MITALINNWLNIFSAPALEVTEIVVEPVYYDEGDLITVIRWVDDTASGVQVGRIVMVIDDMSALVEFGNTIEMVYMYQVVS